LKGLIAGYCQGDRKGKWLAIVKEIEKAIAGYLYYLYDLLKRHWIFLKIEN